MTQALILRSALLRASRRMRPRSRSRAQAFDNRVQRKKAPRIGAPLTRLVLVTDRDVCGHTRHGTMFPADGHNRWKRHTRFRNRRRSHYRRHMNCRSSQGRHSRPHPARRLRSGQPQSQVRRTATNAAAGELSAASMETSITARTSATATVAGERRRSRRERRHNTKRA